MKLVNQAFFEKRSHRARSTANSNVTTPRGLPSHGERAAGGFIDEVKGGGALHRHGGTRAVGENEDRGVKGRVVTLQYQENAYQAMEQFLAR